MNDSKYNVATSLKGGTGNANYKTHSTIFSIEPSQQTYLSNQIEIYRIAKSCCQADRPDRQTDTIHAKWFINSWPSIMRGRGSYLAFIPRNASSLWRCRTEQNGDRAKVKDLVHAEPPIPLLQLQVDCK